MRINISTGEAIDKLNILEIKYKNIENIDKKNLVKKEIDELSECNSIINNFQLYYKMLTIVNKKIWDMTDTIKSIDFNDTNYSYISYQIFEFNQKRFRIKSFFNLLTDSNVKEQKSYSSSMCRILIDDIQTFYKKLPEINYLSIEYDIIVFDTKYTVIINNIIKQPNIVFNNEITTNKTIILSEFTIDETIRDEFDFDTVSYMCGGLLGDFINSLSVPFENFKKNGKRATLYIGNGGDNFKYGIENTYNDIYSIVSKQFYIKEFKIYSGEPFDINLNNWRHCNKLYIDSFYEIYKMTYNVEWGSEKWLYIDIDNNIKSKWYDKVIINTTPYRFPDNINFNKLYEIYNNKLIFVSNDPEHYKHFVEKTKLNIEYYNSCSFSEICQIIHSCKEFIGSLSLPLSIAHAFDIKRTIGYPRNCPDMIMIYKLDKYWINMNIPSI